MGKLQPLSWKEIAKLFDMIATVFLGDHLTEVPRHDEMPSVEIEADCDEYCRCLSENLYDLPPPPEHIQGWMFVRAVSAAGHASALAESEELARHVLDAKLIQCLLIDEWYRSLRQLWPKLEDWRESDYSQPPPDAGDQTPE